MMQQFTLPGIAFGPCVAVLGQKDSKLFVILTEDSLETLWLCPGSSDEDTFAQVLRDLLTDALKAILVLIEINDENHASFRIGAHGFDVSLQEGLYHFTPAPGRTKHLHGTVTQGVVTLKSNQNLPIRVVLDEDEHVGLLPIDAQESTSFRVRASIRSPVTSISLSRRTCVGSR